MKFKNTVGMCIAGILIAQGCAVPVEDGEQYAGAAHALEQPKLLALGDSIAFGYDPFDDFSKKTNFEGYPELLGEYYSVKNASCPGESSASFSSSLAADNGCRGYRDAYKLHVNYGNSDTQLDYALSRLADPNDMPDLITFNISGNDIFLLQQSCNYDPVCFQQGAPAMIGTLATNVAITLGTLRATGYQGPLVFVNLYSTTYTDNATVGLVFAINQAIASVLPLSGAQEADAFSAFAIAAGAQSPCDAGLLIPLPEGPGCDVHPSLMGSEVLADAVLDAL